VLLIVVAVHFLVLRLTVLDVDLVAAVDVAFAAGEGGAVDVAGDEPDKKRGRLVAVGELGDVESGGREADVNGEVEFEAAGLGCAREEGYCGEVEGSQLVEVPRRPWYHRCQASRLKILVLSIVR
jgi:hypothetical protein